MSRIPYALISDTHNHHWNQFATETPDGVNGRLQIIIDETKRAAKAIKLAGGTHLFHGGDLFHVRGKIAPSVLNPTKDCYKEVLADGIDVTINAGNHDLEGKNSSRLGSAVTALEDIGCTVISETTLIGLSELHQVFMIPWIDKVADLKVEIQRVADLCKLGATGTIYDLIIHAPIDGVIPGLPDHGLDPVWLGTLGFDRVFSGHYHNYKDFGNGVWSIGALTHHTWSDVNSKAGFLLSTEEGVRYCASHAPSFIEVDAATDPAEIPLLVPGNYVKVKINSSKTSDIAAVRQLMTDNGAVGVVILPQKVATTPSRTGATVKAGQTLEGSVNAFIDGGEFTDKPKLSTLCLDILSTVRSVAS